MTKKSAKRKEQASKEQAKESLEVGEELKRKLDAAKEILPSKLFDELYKKVVNNSELTLQQKIMAVEEAVRTYINAMVQPGEPVGVVASSVYRGARNTDDPQDLPLRGPYGVRRDPRAAQAHRDS